MSTMIDRSACHPRSSYPQPLVPPTLLSPTSSPSPLLILLPPQSLTLPSSILAYMHPADLTNPSKCLQTPLSTCQMPHPQRTSCLSQSDQLRARNHLCRPIPLQQPSLPIPSFTQTSSEPLPTASSPPLLDVRHRQPLKCAAFKSKLKAYTTMLSTTKTNLNEPPMVTSLMMDKSLNSTFPWATGSTTQPNGSKG